MRFQQRGKARHRNDDFQLILYHGVDVAKCRPGACLLSVLRQRGLRRNKAELSGIGWNKEFNRFKPMEDKGASYLNYKLRGLVTLY